MLHTVPVSTLSTVSSNSFDWSEQRAHLGIAHKVNSNPLLVPNLDYQIPPSICKVNNDIIDVIDDNENIINDGSNPVLDCRNTKFGVLLNSPNIDLDKLRNLAWNGIPSNLRPDTWKILSGYLPTNCDRRIQTLSRKRLDYKNMIPQFNKVKEAFISKINYDENDLAEYRQIHIDVLRTGPSSKLIQQDIVQNSLECILYCWALRHPASGYVQGINDLLTVFYVVFLSEYTNDLNDINSFDVNLLSKEQIEYLEADCFFCLSNFLNHIQENYTFAQIGLQKMIFKLEELVSKIDPKLAKHLDDHHAGFIQFAFRWMNCLLMREIPLKLIIRMWDTYLAEADEFGSFHIYVSASFLIHWSDSIQKLDSFQDIMIFLQRLPTSKWTDKDIEIILSQAYLYKTLYHGSITQLSNE